MTKLLSSVLVSAALLLGACGQNSAQPEPKTEADATNADGRVYRVAMNAAFAPFESVDSEGNIVGFDVDIVKAMAEAGNFKVTFVNTPWEGIFETLRRGDNDILAATVTITDERKQIMDFSDPYFEINQVILVPKGQNIQSPEDLKKLAKVAVTIGTSADTVAQKILGATSDKIARFESLPLVLKEVETGGAQAAISDNAVVENYVKNNGDKGFTIIETDLFEKEHYGMAVRKGDTETRDMLNAALKKIQENGEYDRVYNSYFAK
ncbi:MAG: basic amino acid ABC transporter substrate-binding protein [Neisseriaceae bacterium]|nr:basic amino acid ABC transporter substrate-binding protein [Neisseriaceae bacterium]